MADVLFPTSTFVLSQGVYQTAPVTGGEEGSAPAIKDGFLQPPVFPSGLADVAEDLLSGIPVLPPTQPAPPSPPPSPTANFCLLYGGDLYNRIHAIPSTLALGNVLGQQIRSVEIWNAFGVSQILGSITEIDLEGIFINRPEGPEPTNYLPYASKIYDFVVTTTGPASISGSAQFNFVPNTPIVTITGTRVILFPLECENDIRERLDFLTGVLEARDGNETRQALRTNPRQTFDMKYVMPDTDEIRRKVLNKIYGHQGLPFAVPLFQWSRMLENDLSIGDTLIQVDTEFADFRDSTADDRSIIVLWRSPIDFEIAEIAVGGLTPTSITTALPLEQDHDAGDTWVVPVEISLSKDPISWAEAQNGQINMRVSWLLDRETDLGDLTNFPLNTDGRPILDGPNFLQEGSLEVAIEKDYFLFDGETGPFEVISGRDTPFVIQSKGFFANTAESAWTLRRNLYGFNGKQKSFWLPTFANDFVTIGDILSSDTSLTVENFDYDLFVGGQGTWSGLRILKTDGTVFYRVITGSSIGGIPEEESIIMDSSLGQTILKADIDKISIMTLSRFDSDKQLIEWIRKNEIQVTIPVAGVPQ